MLRKPLFVAFLLAFVPPAFAAGRDDLQPTGTFSVYGGTPAATPPMGWNPWNAFRTEVDEAKIIDAAETIRRTGLAKAGYRYINLDDGWWLRRGPDGKLIIRTSIFPSAAVGPEGRTSFRPLTDRLHAMGFKAGLYTDSGKNSCSQRHDPKSPNLPEGSVLEREIGLDGHEYGDLRLYFQEWGFDYVKVDACGLADFGADNATVDAGQYEEFPVEFTRGQPDTSNLAVVETRYARIGRLLKDLNTDGDFVLAICVWGEADSRKWGGRHGNLWRTSADIEPTWESMLHNFDSAARRELYAGPGRWNDPDMMAIGLGDFDGRHLTEARSHFSLWSILSAPLLMGFDVSRAPAPILDILLNQEAIAVNQDRAGNQAILVHDDGVTQVLVKTLDGTGERAVVILNRGEHQVDSQVTWKQLKLQAGTEASVRDLWTHAQPVAGKDMLKVSVGPREARMFRITGRPLAGSGRFLSEMTGRINAAVDGVTAVNADVTAASGGPRADLTPQGKQISLGGHRQAYGIGIHANSRLEILAKGEFGRFRAMVGVDDSSPATQDKALFRIYGDRKLLFQGKPLARGAAPVAVDLDVSGVQILELVSESSTATELPMVTAWGDARLD